MYLILILSKKRQELEGTERFFLKILRGTKLGPPKIQYSFKREHCHISILRLFFPLYRNYKSISNLLDDKYIKARVSKAILTYPSL